MAEIDKSLPNVKQTIEIPSPDEIAVEVEKEQQEPDTPINIKPNEDGSVDIDFDPSVGSQEQGQDHFANLAELLPDEVLSPIGNELYDNYVDYKSGRKDWESSYTNGLELLGFKYEEKSEPFKGASGATHPVLAEAVTQFQALAYKELLPSQGPVRTQIIGTPTPDKEQQSLRVKEFMNYQIMSEMKEYESEFDQMLFYLPLTGSTFKKVYYDEIMQRTVSKFVPADDLVVPYTATSLDDAETIIHVVKMSENELRKQQVAGFYRDVELTPGQDNETDAQRKERELDGMAKGRNQPMFTLLECHVNLDIEGFEDTDTQGQATGIKLPYIVTVEEASREVLSIRRNYEVGDATRSKIQYFVNFKFLTGLGFFLGSLLALEGVFVTLVVFFVSFLLAASNSLLGFFVLSTFFLGFFFVTVLEVVFFDSSWLLSFSFVVRRISFGLLSICSFFDVASLVFGLLGFVSTSSVFKSANFG